MKEEKEMARRFRATPKNEIRFRNPTESLRELVYCADPAIQVNVGTQVSVQERWDA